MISYSGLVIMLGSVLIAGGNKATTMAFQRHVSFHSSVVRRGLVGGKSTINKNPICPTTTNNNNNNRRLSFNFFAKLEEEVDPGKVDGTDLRIVKYPHPSLRAENAEITKEELKDGSIAQLAKEMFLYMYEAEGVGLAAPQVGVNKRMMVYNQSGDKKRWLDEIVMVNPKIVEYSEAKDVDIEGCLSFPDMGGDVERSKWIKVEAQNLKGKKIKRKFTGWEARIFQHEYDHLDGVVYIDHLDEKDLKEAKPVLDKLIEDFGEGGKL